MFVNFNKIHDYTLNVIKILWFLDMILKFQGYILIQNTKSDVYNIRTVYYSYLITST